VVSKFRRGDEIVHVNLMLQDHQGDDVTGGSGVSCRFQKKRFKFVRFAGEVGFAALAFVVSRADKIATMDLITMSAGHIPAAPTLGQWRAVASLRKCR